MSQIPPPAKWRRALTLLRAQFLAPSKLLQDTTLLSSEKAALALRGLPDPAKRPAQKVVFLIPLVGREMVQDWEMVVARLRHTLLRFCAQNNPNWQAIIACQNTPRLPADPRIALIPFVPRNEGNDKWEKLAALVTHWSAQEHGAGYVMSFDADDLAHPDLVNEMLSGQAPGGYLMREGYVRDVQQAQVARAGAPGLWSPRRKAFWKLCGSCAALRFDMSRERRAIFAKMYGEMLQHEHRLFPYLAALSGAPLQPMQHPRVIYELNHGDNFGVRRGRVHFKQRFVERYACQSQDELAQIARNFPQLSVPDAPG